MTEQALTLTENYANMVKALESPPHVIIDQISDDVIVDRKPEYSKIKAAYKSARLLHAAMGCVTEAGELMDQMKRHLVYGKPIDEVNFQEELGDMLWYIQLACLVMNVTPEFLLEQNMRKLQVRFGDRFDFTKVFERDLAKERLALEDKSGE